MKVIIEGFALHDIYKGTSKKDGKEQEYTALTFRNFETFEEIRLFAGRDSVIGAKVGDKVLIETYVNGKKNPLEIRYYTSVVRVEK